MTLKYVFILKYHVHPLFSSTLHCVYEQKTVYDYWLFLSHCRAITIVSACLTSLVKPFSLGFCYSVQTLSNINFLKPQCLMNNSRFHNHHKVVNSIFFSFLCLLRHQRHCFRHFHTGLKIQSRWRSGKFTRNIWNYIRMHERTRIFLTICVCDGNN